MRATHEPLLTVRDLAVTFGVRGQREVQAVDEAVDRGRLSTRGVDKVLRLAWTIADLAGRDMPGRDELAIALAMRRGEQPGTAKREAIGS